MVHIPVFNENWLIFVCYINILLWLIFSSFSSSSAYSFFTFVLLACCCCCFSFFRVWIHSKDIWKWIPADWKPTDLSIKYYRTMFKVYSVGLLAIIYSIFMSRWYHYFSSLSVFVRLPNHHQNIHNNQWFQKGHAVATSIILCIYFSYRIYSSTRNLFEISVTECQLWIMKRQIQMVINVIPRHRTPKRSTFAR